MKTKENGKDNEEKSTVMSPKEMKIIDDSVKTADSWGLGRISLVKENLKEGGFEFTEKTENYIFNTYVADDT